MENTPLDCIPIQTDLILFGIIFQYYNCVHNIFSGITIVFPIFDTHNVVTCSIELKRQVIIKKNFMYTNLKIEQAALPLCDFLLGGTHKPRFIANRRAHITIKYMMLAQRPWKTCISYYSHDKNNKILQSSITAVVYLCTIVLYK